MREIKFRAWFNDEIHDEIVLVDHQYCVVDKGLGCPLNTGIKGFLSHDDPDSPMILMQYTGRKDKNGVEIYEGDITNRGIVEWCECLNWDSGGSPHPGFYFKNSEDNELEYHLGFDKNIEVLGNIYENPELLKGET